MLGPEVKELRERMARLFALYSYSDTDVRAFLWAAYLSDALSRTVDYDRRSVPLMEPGGFLRRFGVAAEYQKQWSDRFRRAGGP
jgi:hypothetical protein